MLSPADNGLLTKVGPGTPMGELMRRYWLPFIYSSELEADGPPQRVRLLGEDLIAYRDTSGRVGLMAAACPHRGASMFFGRNEEDGLRGVYHGWKFDVTGACVDMPNEPAESNFKHKIGATAYAAAEQGEVVWAYMGPRQQDPPGLPQFEWALVPPEQRHFRWKAVRDCNWLQAIEGDVDTSHLYFLHGRLHEAGSPAHGVYHRDKSPVLQVTETPIGLLYAARRDEGIEGYYWRTAQHLMPCFTLIPADPDGLTPCVMWIPIDDEHTLTWQLAWHPTVPLNDRELKRPGGVGPLAPQQGVAYPEWRTVATVENGFLIDREEQRRHSFTGIPTIPLQDTAVTVSMGAINDRTKEHLGTTDAMIIATRRTLLRAAKALRDRGQEPPGAEDPSLFRTRSIAIVLPRDVDWLEATRDWHFARGGLPAGIGGGAIM